MRKKGREGREGEGGQRRKEEGNGRKMECGEKRRKRMVMEELQVSDAIQKCLEGNVGKKAFWN